MMEVLGLILVIGTAVLLSLGFVFVATYMLRGILKAARGEQIFPPEVGPDEQRALLGVERAARETVNSTPDSERSSDLLHLAVSLHDLDRARDKKKLRELEKGDGGRK